MNQDEIDAQLENGEELGVVLNGATLESGIRFKRVALLTKKAPDKTGLYSWHYLQENPSYVREQKILQTKPYELSLFTSADVPQLMDLVYIHFSNLDELDLFLQQFGKMVVDLHRISDAEIEP